MKVIEHEDADCRREIGIAPAGVNLLQQRRHRRLLLIGDLAQAFPEFIFELDADFVPE